MDHDAVQRIAELERELAALRHELGPQLGQATEPRREQQDDAPIGGRRRALKLAGVAAAGATAAALVRPGTAAAADTDPVLQGVVNNATATTQIIASSDSGMYLSGSAYGVETDGGVANALFVASGVAPTADLPAGSLYVDASGSWWAKVAAGGAGWRELAGPAAAGSFHPITPARVYDSRFPMTPMTSGVIATGGFRTITIADRRDVDTGAVVAQNAIPVTATAVAYNITVTATSGAGYVAVNPGLDTNVYASVANWSVAGTTVANASVVGLDTSRRMTVVAGGPAGAATHVIVDVNGYYA